MTEISRTTIPDSFEQQQRPLGGAAARLRLLAALPVAERRLRPAGISTAVLEGGDGPPVVLLHGPSGYAAHWMGVIPSLVAGHRVIAPDLPGHGASEADGGAPLDAARMLAWLGELIERTCSEPPALVGHALGGALAARFAIEDAARGNGRLSRLVLIDTLGLAPFRPAPEFGLALTAFLDRPTERTHGDLWRRCAFDLDGVKRRLDALWPPFEAYNLDRAREPAGRAALPGIMAQLGAPEIPPADLARIAVPVTLVWGRHDLATPLATAEAASARHGWPLHVIEDCGDDPAVEQPERLLQILTAELAGG